MANDHLILKEHHNVQEIKQNCLTLTIDGLPEVKDKTTTQVVIDRLNNDAKVTMEACDFVSAHRVGKPRKSK